MENLVANLTALHAASLAVAKELECEDNGGLPEKLGPDFQPLPASVGVPRGGIADKELSTMRP
ncbi:hypothetical protein [Streptomyces sp. TE33382]